MPRNYESLLLPLLSYLSVYLVQGTEIKWKGTSHGDDPAKTAPKSQRYWDENNIERPDYAKTDAEIAAERGDIVPNYSTIVIVTLIIAGAIYLARGRGSGQRLGGSRIGVVGTSSQSALFSRESNEERAREARLARFENQREEATKND